jgi:UDP-N-acetylmuramoyl-L-alanyl-D-glutamate--2,6-diaminopimelate ligase
MRLAQLTAGLATAGPSPREPGADVEITGLAYDSRATRRGELFFCVSGFTSDGHEFAPQAVANGAAALVVERPLGLGVPEVRVASARAAMAPLARCFFGDPTAALEVVGITGTNGKTTTAYLVRSLLEAAGTGCGLLGTVTSVVAGQERPVVRTTPEAIDLQSDFRAMLDGGDGACAMEVSSHALALGRTDGIQFAAAVFTNLSRDHLDFHDTMEDYFQSKRRLFIPPRAEVAAGAGLGVSAARPPRVSVVNVGDAYGQRLAAELEGALTFALEAPADFSAVQLRCGQDGCRFQLRTPYGAREVALPLPGRFNVANALGALAAVHALGVDLDESVAALERGVRVPGRFEPVDEGQGFTVLVDYAHTPDSLENVLRAASELADLAPHGAGRVLCVFGAGGDRDRGKRPQMGAIAARLSDVALVTSDNPRSEDPDVIIAEILAGIPGGGPREPARRAREVLAIADRAEAIARAIECARRGDVIVIAGKGHEQGQEFAGGRKVPFDDVAVAREALRAGSAGGPARAGSAAPPSEIRGRATQEAVPRA